MSNMSHSQRYILDDPQIQQRIVSQVVCDALFDSSAPGKLSLSSLYVCVCLSLSLSLSLYIYIYILRKKRAQALNG